MVIAIDGKWIWDSWYARDGGTCHGFFPQANRNLGDPDLRHLNVTQGHATLTDPVNWAHLGTMLDPAKAPAWDDGTTWTGSVLQDDAGTWHSTPARRWPRNRCISASVTPPRPICTIGNPKAMACVWI